MPSPVPRRVTGLRRRVARFIDPDRATRPGSAGATGRAPRVGGAEGGPYSPPVAPAVVSGPAPLPTRVGVVASDRLRRLMADEWHQTDLAAAERPEGVDLVLLEARNGAVAGWTRGAEELAALVHESAAAGTPVALWITAGPVPDWEWLGEVSVLAAATAALRDELATRSGQHVHLLAPAAQPRRHRPAGPPHARRAATVVVEEQDGGVAVAALGELVGAAIQPMKSGDVYVQGIGRSSSWFDDVQGSLKRPLENREWSLVEMDLSSHRVAVDLSGVSTDSGWTSMAAAASATPLVGIDGLSAALPADVAALVPRVEDGKHLRRELVARIEQTELVAREGLRLQRAVLHSHTAAHRARAVVASAGLPGAESAARTISAIIPTNRAHEVDNIFANVGRQAHAQRELVLVLHGLTLDHADLRRRAAEAGIADLAIVDADPSLTLGACMNLGVDAASGRYVAKMDDDNFYGVHYLGDLLDAFSYTDAGIVGKWCHYVWLRSSNAVVLRYPESEHRPERRIQGGSMVFDGDVVRHLRFSDIPRAVDSDILDRATAEGIGIYSADRFNFVSIRGTDRHAHTWTVADSTFMTKRGRLQFFGDPRPHVSV
ncbi:glycosyltransferase family 2 protein [Intrasporangium calvum]|uniref:Glycosyltransferase family 2 protein n=1 Tax=Intrasporangium calvum TaxID=53358 RepID=A0ABT5GES0_9MICO|nr:glycosyltransferase family A protein [Intrasporangium calvum]MDC5696755.1 glycosyltransferase family 2 protein [Intrasporangium calvum]